MPDIILEDNIEELTPVVRAVYSDQMPYAIASAVNRTALDAQRFQRGHQRRIFDVTRPDFVDRAVKIWPFANKRDIDSPEGIRARLIVDPPGGRRRRDVISKFEEDETKRPHRSRFLWVPINAPTKNPDWTPKGLRLRKQRFSRRSRVGREGGRARQAVILRSQEKPGVFGIIRKDGETSMIFERERGDDELNLLWVSRKSVDIHPNLRFVENITEEVGRRWEGNFVAAFDRAIQTARTPSFTSPRAAVGLGVRSLAGGAPRLGGFV